MFSLSLLWLWQVGPAQARPDRFRRSSHCLSLSSALQTDMHLLDQAHNKVNDALEHASKHLHMTRSWHTSLVVRKGFIAKSNSKIREHLWRL
jgi:hypothetical protein